MDHNGTIDGLFERSIESGNECTKSSLFAEVFRRRATTWSLLKRPAIKSFRAKIEKESNKADSVENGVKRSLPIPPLLHQFWTNTRT